LPELSIVSKEASLPEEFLSPQEEERDRIENSTSNSIWKKKKWSLKNPGLHACNLEWKSE
jgi:hypothetical protein